MFQIFAIRRLTAFVTRVAKANGSTSNLVPKILLGVLAALSPAAAQILPICTYNAWDAMTVGNPFTVQKNYWDIRISDGTNYITSECTGNYTVDIILPNVDPFPGVSAINIWAGPAQLSHLTQDTCLSASVSVQIFRRSSLGGSWKPEPGQNVTGTWIGDQHGFCSLMTPLRVFLENDVYRVMVLPKLSGVPVQAMVWWEWSNE
jgi:hypothetical protein